MSRPHYTFSEFIDLILARLYELEQSQGASSFFDVNAINEQLKEPVDAQWVFDAGKVLESRGLAQCVFAFGGVCQARLTGEGRLFVEERRDRASETIGKYYRHPDNYVVVSGIGNKVVVGGRDVTANQNTSIQQERAPAFQLLGNIRNRVADDQRLSEQERGDVLSDLDMVEQQLRKREPNRSALAAILEPLGQIASIAGLVSTLIRLLNP